MIYKIYLEFKFFLKKILFKEKIIAIGIHPWKREVFKNFINKKTDILFFSKKIDAQKIISRIKKYNIKKIYVWGNQDISQITSQFPEMKLIRVEDGFIRSIGLGSEHILPLSLCFDKMGIYYDCHHESELEKILNNIKCNEDEIKFAKKIINIIIDNNISKYNLNNVCISDKIKNIISLNKVKVLVIEQVSNDESIIFGQKKVITNKELLQTAINENKNSIILYKRHPDIVSKKRFESINFYDIKSNNVIIIDEKIDVVQLLNYVDKVYTITSLSGMEALLRGKKVITLGCPFYSGWGLTEDREKISRRKRILSIEELFIGAYIKYPKYILPNKNNVSLNEVINFIISSKKNINNELKLDSENTKFNLLNIGENKILANSPWDITNIKKIIQKYDENEDYVRLLNFLKQACIKTNNSEIIYYYCRYLKKYGHYEPLILENLENILSRDPHNIKYRFFLCEYIWETKGVNKKLLENINLLKKEKDLTSNQKQFIAACLCEMGKYNDALSIIESENNIRYFFLKSIFFSMKLNKNKLIKKSFNILSNQNTFESIIYQNSFAVVGNGPSEIGTKNGENIDKNNIVIRFNNYNINYPYFIDYGLKTDIWVKSGYYIDISRKNILNYKLIIQSGINPLFRNINFFDFATDLCSLDVSFTCIPSDIYYELIDILKASPSSGLAILYWIYKIRGKINRNNIFGFSFGQTNNYSSDHYFSNSKSSGFYPHQWEKEGILLREIIND